MKYALKLLFAFVLVSIPLAFIACDPDEPAPENEEEVINKVTLTFTPNGGGAAKIFTAFDPDGEGSAPIELEPIVLALNTTYTLTLKLENTLEGEDLTTEIEEEADEHMFFFGWTNVFGNPTGSGNIGADQRNQPVNYNDTDSNGLPLGLTTTWTTAGSVATGTFRIILKHQPNSKSTTSTSDTGETDVDLTFTISIE